VTEAKEDRKHASARAAADHLCIDPSTFSKYLNQGVIKRQPRHIGYDLDECRRARFKFLENQAAGRSGEDGGELLSKQRARLATAQADAQIMRTGIMSGEYVRLEVFARVLDELFVVLREIALGMPGKVADAVAEACGGDRALAFRIIDDEVREMLTLLSTPDIVAQGEGNPQERRQRRADIERIPA
jgi:hypothetical protein